MDKIVTFGEVLLRLSTEQHLRISQSKRFNVSYGGGEFNVAVSLANFGLPVEFITRLPQNEVGLCALREMRKFKVDCQNVLFGGDRLGIYFLELGTGIRGSKVLYDRANSAMATIEKNSIDWEDVFRDAAWFHWSGITPAISNSAAQVCLEAVNAAHQLGIMVSSDLNYRSKLWRYGKQPSEVMPELLHYSNVILGDLDTANFMLGKPKVNPDYKDIQSLPGLYEDVYKGLPNLKIFATTLRYSKGASHQKIGGILYDGQSVFNVEEKDVAPVVDRVGSGDAFMSGLIYGLLKDKSDKQKALNIAVAACRLKHTISGDYNLITIEDIENLLQGDDSAKIIR